jgi:integrase/recombinase XerD
LINALPRKGSLVLSEDGVTPEYYLLKDLKRIAVTAGLDPAHCWLHKFRASGASRYFQAGMPLPDIMKLGGWRDVDSVKRYMGLLTKDRLEQAVESAWA